MRSRVCKRPRYREFSNLWERRVDGAFACVQKDVFKEALLMCRKGAWKRPTCVEKAVFHGMLKYVEKDMLKGVLQCVHVLIGSYLFSKSDLRQRVAIMLL